MTGIGSGYAQAHLRIRTDIKIGTCSAPGCTRIDTEIALIHGRGEYADTTGIHAGIPYSTCASDYVELCRSCHRLYDLQAEGPTTRQLVAARAAMGEAACGRCGRVLKANGLAIHARYCGQERPSCSVDDCSQPARTRGYCGTHYERWRKHGSPLVVLRSSGQFTPGHVPHNRQADLRR